KTARKRPGDVAGAEDAPADWVRHAKSPSPYPLPEYRERKKKKSACERYFAQSMGSRGSNVVVISTLRPWRASWIARASSLTCREKRALRRAGRLRAMASAMSAMPRQKSMLEAPRYLGTGRCVPLRRMRLRNG